MKKLLLFLSSLLVAACSSFSPDYAGMPGNDSSDGHGMIVLGERLDDPYTVENMAEAVQSLYPTKAGICVIEATDLYVRFLPASQQEYDLLESLGLEMTDHPLDYRIVREGDYYRDPGIAEDEITWQYCVVDKDFDFPQGIRHEIIDRCYISEHDTKADPWGIDWDAVERESYRLTGNSDLIAENTKSGTGCPEGRITILDKDYDDEPVGVAGVRVSCNSFVKFANAYTDDEGYYKMTRSFSSNVRYRLVFRNVNGFGIGFNLILVPASVSSLGRHAPEGFSTTIDPSSERKLFSRCVVNNAGYDYFKACKEAKIKTPPSNFRLWLFQNLNISLPALLQQGTLIDNSAVGEYLGVYAALLKIFLPDSFVALKGRNSYSEIYSEAIHQFAHGSHFMNVGTSFWDNLVKYDVLSFISSGRIYYGVGTESGHEYCEMAEMWAYYMQTVLYRDRYNDSDLSFGTQYWFKPQLLLYMDERGLTRSKLFAAFTSDITDREKLREKLLSLYPESKSVINQSFVRYE